MLYISLSLLSFARRWWCIESFFPSWSMTDKETKQRMHQAQTHTTDSMIHKRHTHKNKENTRLLGKTTSYIWSVFKMSCLFLRPRLWQFEI